MSGGRAYTAAGIIACLVTSALALVFAPKLMPPDYSWLTHTTSESAAQGVDGAWLARLGFLLFGLGVIWLAALKRRAWGRWAPVLHVCFGVFMIAAAVFSARPWDPNLPYDPIEDLLHSVAATAMGFSFAFGVVAIVLRRTDNDLTVRWLDAVAIVASVVLPVGMMLVTDVAGALQRGIFLVAYAWYGRETLLVWRHESAQ
jgi:hypothetical protein